MSKKKNLTVMAFVLMLLTSVFGVTNIGTAYYRMGYAAIPMFVIAGILFFIPFVLMMVELGTGFDKEKGGIYTWMEKSVNPRFAFVGIMMWYSSYVIWMFGKAFSMWTPLSFALFGKDYPTYKLYFVNGAQLTTDNISGSIDFMPVILGILAVAVVSLLTFIVAKGSAKLTKVTAIGGIAVIALNFILLIGGFIALALNGFELQQPLTAADLITSPNTDYQTIIPFLGFVVFAVFAYGGTEAIAGVADEMENPQKDLQKGIFIAATFIVLAYVFGIFIVGAAVKWDTISAAGGNSLSALFIIMQNLGDTLTGNVDSTLGAILQRFAGLGMFLTYIGAFVALAYAPLKQLIDGTPKEIWPTNFQDENENGIKINALKLQALIVIIFIVVKSVFSIFDPEAAASLFDLIITMTNVGMTIPYVFLIVAWYNFRKNNSLNKNIIMIKSIKLVTVIFVVTFATVIFGNVFTIISPFLSGDYSTGVWTIIGPVLFFIIAMVMYKDAKNN